MSKIGDIRLNNITEALKSTDIFAVYRNKTWIPVKGLRFDDLIFGDPVVLDSSVQVNGYGLGFDITESVDKTSHGFAVGELVYFDGTDYQLAQANNVSTLATGIISLTPTVDQFYVTHMGKVAGLSGLTAGQWYYCSDSVGGQLTTTAGSTLINPIGRALSTTELMVLPMRADYATGTLTDLTTESEYDSTNDQYLYTGRAEQGSATSSAVWKISRFDFSTGSTTFADGNESYDNIWDNRESLSYS